MTEYQVAYRYTTGSSIIVDADTEEEATAAAHRLLDGWNSSIKVDSVKPLKETP